MGLTWRDGVTTLLMAALVAIYVAFLRGTDIWLISSARGTATAVLVIGMFGCTLSATRDLYAGPHPQGGHMYRTITTVDGVFAFAAALVALVTGSTAALAVLVGMTLSLWVLATARHAFTPPRAREPEMPGPARNRDNHEVIHQGDATRP